MHKALAPITLFALATASLAGCAQNTDDDASAPTEAQAASGTCGGRLAVASVSASGAQAGNPAAQAVDGNETTRWSDEGVGAAITADLGSTKSVCGVRIAWYQGNTRKNTFAVAVSTDGKSFATVHTGTSGGTTADFEATTFAATNARYVRVTVDGNTTNDWASVDELEVDGGAAAGGFVHPGVLVSQAQLNLVKGKIAASVQPWKGQYDLMAGSKYVRSGWAAAPRATIECGSYNNPDYGCTQEYDDANAAYGNALMWAYTGNTKYAGVSIAILDAYAKTVKSHTNSNAPLEAAWAAERFVRAAEIVRHTAAGWPSADAAAFASFMRTVYLPLVEKGWPTGNGNWDLSMIDATVSIAVFTDDRATFDGAVALWKNRVPTYIYRTKDGAIPLRPVGTSAYNTNAAQLTHWYWPMTGSGASAAPKYPLPEGVAQETCRDFNHVSMGLTSMIDAAETAYLQGVDLYSYSDFATRIPEALEFHSKYLNGAALPASLCGGEAAFRNSGIGFLNKSPEALALNFAVGYNHYANRLGVSLPQTAQTLAAIDANGSAYRDKVGQTAAWENLTNAEKLPPHPALPVTRYGGVATPVNSTSSKSTRQPEFAAAPR